MTWLRRLLATVCTECGRPWYALADLLDPDL
jgi:hypothetical protein